MTGWVGVAHLLTQRQAAAALAVSMWTLARLRREGHLPAIQVGNTWRFHPDDIEAYVNRRRTA